jgi:hypothetical protein
MESQRIVITFTVAEKNVLSPTHSDWFSVWPSFLFNCLPPVIELPQCEANHTPPTIDEFKNVWNYTSISSTTLLLLSSTAESHAPIWNYCISRPIRRTFFPPKNDLNSTCVLCAEGKYYFRTYKYPYMYYTTSLSWYDFSGSDNHFLGFCNE